MLHSPRASELDVQLEETILGLRHTLEETLPRDLWRAGEYAFKGHMVGALACLAQEIPPALLELLLSHTALDAEQKEQAQALLHIRCWRHNVRIDSLGGFGLYIERDFEQALQTRFCRWFSKSNRIFQGALRAEEKGFTFWSVGVHWIPLAAPRLRFYLVNQPNSEAWQNLPHSIESLFDVPLQAKDRSLLTGVMRVPRRACCLNLEEREGRIAVKLELPGVFIDEIDSLLPTPALNFAQQALSISRSSLLRHLGVRFRAECDPSFTFYTALKRNEEVS